MECRLITEAARQAFVTQPMISNSVRDLEKEIGIEIFSRNAKKISITSEGAEFLSYARQVVEQTELLERRYTGKKNGVANLFVFYAALCVRCKCVCKFRKENERRGIRFYAQGNAHL